MRYFQINTIPHSAACDPKIKNGFALKEKRMGGTQNRILTGDLEIYPELN